MMEAGKALSSTATVIVKGRIFGDRTVDKLAHMMGWSVREALGCLIQIWGASQTHGKAFATGQEITDWAMEWERPEELLKSLRAARWITEWATNEMGEAVEFLIEGNGEVFESIDQAKRRRIDAAKAAAQARWHGKTGGEDLETGPGDTESHLTALPSQCERNANACDSMRFDASMSLSQSLSKSQSESWSEKEEIPVTLFGEPAVEAEKPRGKPGRKPKFDFEKIFDERYPLKSERSTGIERARQQIKTQEDFEAFALAVENYRAHVEARGIEQAFVKLFRNFVGSKRSGHPWRDWIAPPAAAGPTPTPPGGRSRFDAISAQNQAQAERIRNRLLAASASPEPAEGARDGE